MLPSKRVLVLSDLHCGASAGLTPPKWQFEELALLQVPLWNWYKAEVQKIGPVDMLVVNGDMVDGEGKKETLDQITTDVGKQIKMAIACLEIVKAKQIVMTYGTPFHTVGSFDYEEPIAEHFGCSIRDTQKVRVNGTLFNFRHVIGQSGTAYTQGTQAYKEAIRELLRAVDMGHAQPEYIIRSHVHNAFQSGSPERAGITSPCLEIPLSRNGRRYRPWRYHVGMMEFVVDEKGRVHYDQRAHIMPLTVVLPEEIIEV